MARSSLVFSATCGGDSPERKWIQGESEQEEPHIHGQLDSTGESVTHETELRLLALIKFGQEKQESCSHN